MRISNQQRQQNEARIRAAMDRLLRGEIPPGGSCDISTLAKEAGSTAPPSTAPAPTRTCAKNSRPASPESAKPATPSAPAKARSADSRTRTRNSKPAWRKPIQKSATSPSSAPQPWPDSRRNMRRSPGSATS